MKYPNRNKKEKKHLVLFTCSRYVPACKAWLHCIKMADALLRVVELYSGIGGMQFAIKKNTVQRAWERWNDYWVCSHYQLRRLWNSYLSCRLLRKSIKTDSDEHAVAKMFHPFAGTVVFISPHAASRSVPLMSSSGWRNESLDNIFMRLENCGSVKR